MMSQPGWFYSLICFAILIVIYCYILLFVVWYYLFVFFIIYYFSFFICYLLFASVTRPTTGTLMILLYWGSWSLRLSLAIWKRIRILCSMSSFYQFVGKKSRKGKKNLNIFHPDYLLNHIIQFFIMILWVKPKSIGKMSF